VDAVSAVVGLGGFALGAVTVYLGYKARLSSYRERLYERRLDAYREVLQRFAELHDEVSRNRAGVHSAEGLEESADAFLLAWRHWAIFLTARIQQPILDYMTTYRSLTSGPSARSKPGESDGEKAASDNWDELGKAYNRVAKAAKKELALEVPDLQIAAVLRDRSGRATSSDRTTELAIGAVVMETFFLSFRRIN
jgi:hypothetical protein